MSLSSLIVQREIASFREVEEALARQVLYGGDFVTNLLEVCRVEEVVLMPAVAESFGMAAAPSGELPPSTDETRKVVAPEVAAERNIFPLSMDRYGLTLAVAAPLSRDAEQELAFALALPIEQKLAPLVRIRQALARDFGIPLDRRQQRLLSRLLGETSTRNSSLPPMHAAPEFKPPPRPPSILPPRGPSITPRAMPKVEGTFVRKTDMPPPPKAKRRRGPLVLDVARAELEEAVERDTIFDLVFEFARQFFDYTALFVVHGEIAEGRDAFGDGAAREKIVRIGVPLDMKGLFGRARESKALVRGVPESLGIDGILMADLARPGSTECLVFPLVVRTRMVALLFCDAGEAGIDPANLVDVQKVVANGAFAFERLIVRRKLLGTNPPPSAMSTSVVPPTQLSEPEVSPPPLRDLVIESVDSAPIDTTPDRRNSSPPSPPPRNLEVRRPSGAPIPREEPDSFGKISIPMPVSSVPSKRPSRRPDAPPLDFAPNPAPSSPSQAPPSDPAPSPRARRPSTKTDVSPVALPMFPAKSEPIEPLVEEPRPIVDPDDEPTTPRVTDDETPLAPSVDLDAETPLAPPLDLPPSPESSRVPMPASEQVVSVPLHRPPARQARASELPSVIVDVATEYVAVVERALAGHDEDAEAELIRGGGHAMPALMARFPGPVSIAEGEEPPRVSECGPLLRLLASQRRTALPFVLAFVDDADENRRFWATYLLSELVYPDAIGKIVERTFDRSTRVRRVALLAARATADAYPGAVVDRYSDIAGDATIEIDRRVKAIDALGALRDPAGVPVAIDRLEKGTMAAAHASLVALTRQDFGEDPARWRAWWAANGKRHRLEWLMDALMHEQTPIRRAAGDELAATTREYFGYYDDLTKRERERVQSRYREWWQNVGRIRFNRNTSR